MKKAFTLVELLVVMAMIMIIAGAFTSSVASSMKRAKISRAVTETREITNAILAYQNYDEDGSLERYAMNDAEASESKLGFILGKVQSRGVNVPVLYNAGVNASGKICDPWGNPYRITIKEGDPVQPPGVSNLKLRMFYPNWHRLSEGERE